MKNFKYLLLYIQIFNRDIQ